MTIGRGRSIKAAVKARAALEALRGEKTIAEIASRHKDYPDVLSLRQGIGEYFTFYNTGRPHQSLGYRTPIDVHLAPSS